MIGLIVIAKEPRPGRVKTRLCPPCTYEEAAALAKAALDDTLAAVGATHGVHRFLALDGSSESLDIPSSIRVLPQRGVGLERRLAAAFADVDLPALLIGMDTPQITPALLEDGLATLRSSAGAVLGSARDGGYWAIGLNDPSVDVFEGVPMSTEYTCLRQRERLLQLNVPVTSLPVLTDVDTYSSATEVAEVAPQTLFARQLRSIASGRATKQGVSA